MIDEPGSEVIVVMPGGGVESQRLLHERDAFLPAAEVEAGQAEEVPDVMASRRMAKEGLVQFSGFRMPAPTMEFHRMVEG